MVLVVGGFVCAYAPGPVGRLGILTLRPLWSSGPGRDALEGDLRGGPRRGSTGGWRRLPKRLGAVTVGYKCD